MLNRGETCLLRAKTLKEMKKKGSISDFTALRNRELLASFRDVLATSRGVPLRDMFGLAVKRPASRFWVSEYRAAEVICAMLRGETIDNQLPQRKAMYDEIYRRVVEWRRENPGRPVSDAVTAVVNSAAPEFYLTEKSAKVIIYSLRRKNKSGDNDE